MTHDTLRRLLHLAAIVTMAAALGLPLLAQETTARDADSGAGELAQADSEGTADVVAAAPEVPSYGTTRRGDLVRVLSDLDVPAGEVIQGDAICIGGDARVAGRIEGELVVVAGSLDLSGEVGRGAVIVISDATYREGARIEGELVHVGGNIEDLGADLPPGGVRMELFGSLTTMIVWIASAELLIMLVIFVLIALTGSSRVALMSEQVVQRYGMALLIGFLVHVGVLIVNVTLIVTVIGIPVAILIDIAFRVLRMFGRTAILHSVGAGIGRGFGRDLSVLGAVLFGFFGLGLVTLVPLFFGIPGLLVAGLVGMLLLVIFDFPAVGVIVLTKLGDPGRPAGVPLATQTLPAAPAPPPPAPE